MKACEDLFPRFIILHSRKLRSSILGGRGGKKRKEKDYVLLSVDDCKRSFTAPCLSRSKTCLPVANEKGSSAPALPGLLSEQYFLPSSCVGLSKYDSNSHLKILLLLNLSTCKHWQFLCSDSCFSLENRCFITGLWLAEAGTEREIIQKPKRNGI